MAHETTVPVKADIARSAEVPDLERYQEIYRQSLDDPDAFWAGEAEGLHWEKRWDTVSAGGFADLDFTWFAGGRLNACHNAVDRHVEQHGDHTAIIWAADEPGTYERISYRELKARVCRIANVLKQHGVKRGDRVCLYMPMIPDTAATMLACARIGAIHSVVFAGFSADALRDRIEDAHCQVVVTGSNYARFKGWGSINGYGDYRFMLWAGDSPDTFGIKIWWEEGDTEHVIYDNGMDQAIGGGSIVIHKKK